MAKKQPKKSAGQAQENYAAARKAYAALGVDTEAAVARALAVPVSLHPWQADDVAGLEVSAAAIAGGGLLATGNYMGRARSGDEIRRDLEQVLALAPGAHRVNVHAFYAETEGKRVERDRLEVRHFARWIAWAKAKKLSQNCGTPALGRANDPKSTAEGGCATNKGRSEIVSKRLGLDFNPTFFSHPLAASGMTLAHADDGIRGFWIRHGIASRRIAEAMAREMGTPCVNNFWIPDGLKDSPADRWGPRERLRAALDEIFDERHGVDRQLCVDAVEGKLFGLGSEDYVVGSNDFYAAYALARRLVLTLDMGHFHPTESVADKLSALLALHERLLLHVSRPIRWDSDHVVIFSDDLRALALELARGNALDRVYLALDYFDPSINRLAAFVIGARATRKALLYALLDPSAELKALEAAGKGAQKLALMEEMKTMPFGAVWDRLCESAGVPAGPAWMAQVEVYEREVLAKRK